MPVIITNQPASVRVMTNTTATFTVGADGFPAPVYQWYQISGGVTNLLLDATNTSYTTAAVLDSNTGTGYYVVVSNTVSTVTSSVATASAGHVLLTSGRLVADQYFGLNTAGNPALTTQLYPGSTPAIPPGHSRRQ